ncbi:glutathione S-transferase family protein [Marinibacterium profundimaris]|uniref:Glutathione S-transferase n=1 Tax=Marinibacterium profundimaris TaxID=1679460 RepID=A0A225NIM7_9RHOB|nr:glutathione S-transferase family protein [Marinibacterium profundimaris]OWU73593.1 glutathione S-transferase [Marinibacterium profundimaris]
MIKVYGQVASRAFRVLWALEEIGLEYELVDAGPQSDTVRAVSGLGKIPALEVDGAILTDSVAIMTFLADRHGALTFEAGTVERGRQDGFTERVNDEFDALLWMAARHGRILPKAHRVPEVIPSLKWEFGRNMERLAAEFEGPYLMGETMTIADILLGHCIGWATLAEFPIESEKMQAYGKALRSRDAYKAVRAKA